MKDPFLCTKTKYNLQSGVTYRQVALDHDRSGIVDELGDTIAKLLEVRNRLITEIPTDDTVTALTEARQSLKWARDQVVDELMNDR